MEMLGNAIIYIRKIFLWKPKVILTNEKINVAAVSVWTSVRNSTRVCQ